VIGCAVTTFATIGVTVRMVLADIAGRARFPESHAPELVRDPQPHASWQELYGADHNDTWDDESPEPAAIEPSQPDSDDAPDDVYRPATGSWRIQVGGYESPVTGVEPR
jgi:hypothetical protein